LIDWDGCSTTCVIEPGWNCNTLYDNPNAPLDKTVCVPICGDGKNVFGEICDDGNTDIIGCKSDCSGPSVGYECTGGSLSTP